MPYKTQRARTAYQREYRARRLKSGPVLAFPGNVPDPAGAVSEWARRCLVVPPGHPREAQAFEIPEYLAAFFADALADDCREGLICLGRKNAKSAGVAVLLLAFLAGPLRRAGWRSGVCSISREKASELKNQCEAIATASGLKGLRFYRRARLPRLPQTTADRLIFSLLIKTLALRVPTTLRLLTSLDCCGKRIETWLTPCARQCPRRLENSWRCLSLGRGRFAAR